MTRLCGDVEATHGILRIDGKDLETKPVPKDAPEVSIVAELKKGSYKLAPVFKLKDGEVGLEELAIRRRSFPSLPSETVCQGGAGSEEQAEHWEFRHTAARCLEADQKRFEQMLRKIFYPGIEDFYPTANGNWEASMIQTMLAMGVFRDDRALFDQAVQYFRHGEGNGCPATIKNSFSDN